MTDRSRPFSQKIVSAEEAIRAIKDGDLVVFSHAATVPQETTKALIANKDNYKNVSIYHMLCLGEGKYTYPDMDGHFRHITNFVGANTRKAIDEKRADFMPCFFFEVPYLFRNGNLKVDVAVVQVTPPDENGNCSFGLSCDYTKPSTQHANIVIAEMNDKLPRIGGDNYINIADIDYIIECSNELPTIAPANVGEVEEAIGKNCASLIDDGATLQLGIGAIPDAVLMFLTDKKDLGIHTEMFTDGVMNLVDKGIINGSKKTLHKGKLVATFLMGSKKLYDFVDNNPSVELYPVDYVNNPHTIMKIDNMVCINSCIEVDLTGQVASESIGQRQFSGVGGQVDYVRGSMFSQGGKSIMAMPSTAAKGTISRIVPFLAHGAAVTTSRNDVDYIVTEYGIAYLKGKTLRQRAKSLIQIAHPNFRDELMNEFKKRFE